MNDKQKRIEEMAKIEIGAILEKVNMGDGYADINSLADQIYHIVIPEDSVILTKEEHENITDNIRNDIAIDIIRAIFELITWNRNTDSFQKGILELVREYSLDMEIEETASKQAVKEVVERLKAEAITIDPWSSTGSAFECVYTEDIDEIAKEFGVEL